MLPHLHPRVRMGRKFRQKAQRLSVRAHGQRRVGCAVHAHGDHILRGYAGFPQHLRDGAAQHLQIVLRILDGPVVGQRRAVGKLPRHHAVRISKDRRGQLLSCVEIDEDGPPRERSVVHADSITTHIQQPPCFSFMIADSRQKNKAQRRKRCAGKREQKVRQRAGERGEAHGAERRPPRPPERL